MSKPVNRVYSRFGTSIFTHMSILANRHGAINLGQGFPDRDGPVEVREAAARYVVEGPNQYPPSPGMPELRKAVAANNRRFWGLDVDWQSQVIVTSGATEALASCFMALLNPGDEAIILEPFYDCYLPMIEQAGAVAKVVALKPPEWSLPATELEAAFSDKTKLIVLNSPMNPAGKAFTRKELGVIAALVEKYDAFAVCDEVYEHLVFDDHEHIPLMSLPGMESRALRIGSAGKTFSLTGWKVGYITGPADLVSIISKAHQFLTFTTPPALQLAVAEGLDMDDSYYKGLADDLESKRDFLSATLKGIGLDVLPCHGTYFLTVDVASLGFKGDDAAFCEDITKNARVAAVPNSAFYHPDSDPPHTLVRFCFCKERDVLEAAARRLERYFK
jgi:aspartate/methionine/tyrosine aminotransferase